MPADDETEQPKEEWNPERWDPSKGHPQSSGDMLDWYGWQLVLTAAFLLGAVGYGAYLILRDVL